MAINTATSAQENRRISSPPDTYLSAVENGNHGKVKNDRSGWLQAQKVPRKSHWQRAKLRNWRVIVQTVTFFYVGFSTTYIKIAKKELTKIVGFYLFYIILHK